MEVGGSRAPSSSSKKVEIGGDKDFEVLHIIVELYLRVVLVGYRDGVKMGS